MMSDFTRRRLEQEDSCWLAGLARGSHEGGTECGEEWPEAASLLRWPSNSRGYASLGQASVGWALPRLSLRSLCAATCMQRSLVGTALTELTSHEGSCTSCHSTRLQQAVVAGYALIALHGGLSAMTGHASCGRDLSLA